MFRLKKEVLSLLLFMGGFWTYVLWPYAITPSVGDSLNHLAFLDLIREQNVLSLKDAIKPFAHEFGSEGAGFYPAGMHVLLAWLLKLTGGLLLGQLGLLFKTVTVFFLCLMSLAFYWGSGKIAKSLSDFDRVLISGIASTLLIFPSAPLGEGGLSRIIGQILALILTLSFIPLSGRRGLGFVVLALLVPALFYIHPSSFFVLVPAFILIFSERRRDWLFLGLGLAVGLVLIAKSVSLGAEDVNHIQLESKPFAESGIFLAFSRLKDIFHFLFADTHGLGKFFSPRTILAAFGLGLIAQGKSTLPKRLSFLLLVPFFLALTALFEMPLLRAPGSVFYHQTKRISEMALFPLFLGWTVGWSGLIARFSSNRYRLLFRSLMLIFFAVSASKAMRTVREMAELYHTPKTEAVELLKKLLTSTPPDSVIVSKDRWFGIGLGIVPKRSWVAGDYFCQNNLQTDYCRNRSSFIDSIYAGVQGSAPSASFGFGNSTLFVIDRVGDGFSLVRVR